MKIICKITIVISFFLTLNSFASSEILSTHVYKNLAIQNIGIANEHDEMHADEIVISKSQFIPNPVNAKLFDIPEIENPIWIITAKDLHVTEDVCLEIDALLCRDYKEMYKTNETMCYDTCISNGPYFVAYDVSAKKVYLGAGTNVSGTGGAPEFLFVADVDTKQITYLNTVVSPYDAYLSTNGTYLALYQGYDGIDVYNTHTGNEIEINGKNYELTIQKPHASLGNIRWLSDTELQYDDMYFDDKLKRNFSTTKNIFNVESKKIVDTQMMK